MDSLDATPCDIRTAGYSVVPGVVSASTVREILSALASCDLVRTRAGARHVLGVFAVRELARDPSLLAVAREHLGRSAIPFRATLFNKSADSNWLVPWHQDNALPVRQRRAVPGWGPWTLKGGMHHAIAPAAALTRVIALRVHLDDSTHRNGPLRVLPGTHTRGLLRREAIEELSATISPVECLVDAGGVIAMRPLVVHSSSKARNGLPRRVLHIEYADSLELDGGIALAVG